MQGWLSADTNEENEWGKETAEKSVLATGVHCFKVVLFKVFLICVCVLCVASIWVPLETVRGHLVP